MIKYYVSCFLLLLALLKCSCQNYYPKLRIGSSFCENNRTFVGFLTQSINNYELALTYLEQSVVLEKRFNASQVKRLKSDCKITIESKSFGKNAGIYVNILKMKMRKYTGPGIKQNECIDSITIKYNDNVKKRFCGDLEHSEIKSFEDHKGKVKITISIDRQMPFSDPEDYVEFQVVATVFKDCNNFQHEFACRRGMKKSCISSNFVNDSIVNCIEPYCSDEKLGCMTSSVISKVDEEPVVIDNLPQIFLSAITSLILTMICCGCCFLTIFKIKRCCCPPPPEATTTTRIHRRRRRSRDANTATTPDSSTTTPSAPAEYDLPPAYDELFPERAKGEADTVTETVSST